MTEFAEPLPFGGAPGSRWSTDRTDWFWTDGLLREALEAHAAHRRRQLSRWRTFAAEICR